VTGIETEVPGRGVSVAVLSVVVLFDMTELLESSSSIRTAVERSDGSSAWTKSCPSWLASLTFPHRSCKDTCFHAKDWNALFSMESLLRIEGYE